MFNSKQRPCDDPKNQPNWEIYPPPPPPSWPPPPPEVLSELKAKEKAREANPIDSVGIDFDPLHVKIPGSHPVSTIVRQLYLKFFNRNYYSMILV